MNAVLKTKRVNSGARHQAGVSLLVVLILLVVMSLLGLAVLRSSAMQERMSANMYDRNLAQQAAEQALLFAREQLDAGVGAKKWDVEEPDDDSCTDFGICHWSKLQSDATVTWQPGPTIGAAPNDNVPATQSWYWVEYLGMNQAHKEAGGVIPASDTTSMGPLFRITARSAADGRANVTLQTDVIYRLPRL
jgi:type IV pilus assembly protein PilX